MSLDSSLSANSNTIRAIQFEDFDEENSLVYLPDPDISINPPSSIDHEEPSIASTDILAPESSTSVASTSYSGFGASPFKNCLKISDSLVIKREKSRFGNKMPQAISGAKARKILEDVQNKKRREIELKEKRKEERERKKQEKEEMLKNKKTQKKKRKRAATSEEDEDPIREVVYDDSSDSNHEENNFCYACYGEEHWTENDKWVGCGSCPRWFHKSCISREVEEMSEEELKKFNLRCDSCQNSKQGNKRTKTN